MIGESVERPDTPADPGKAGRRPTRAEQRAATRLAILGATASCLIEDGYGGLTTRRIAERVGIAQSTVMHHFASREELMVEAVTHIALGLADEALDRIDLSALRDPGNRDAVLDEAWREFTSPPALAAFQLWVAVWNEPELAPTLSSLEQRIGGIIFQTAAALFPDQAGDTRFPALIDAAIALIQGLLLSRPILGEEATDARWEALKPMILSLAGDLLDG